MKGSIEVLCDHKDFVVVNKPIGVAVQNELDQSGILPLLCAQLAVPKLWLVHRLDKVTSGALLLAKNANAAGHLSGLFANRNVDKYYLAISHKKPQKKQGSVVGDMHKVRDGKWMLTKSKQNPAISQFFSAGMGDGHRLFIIRPLSGKTHQIRVMMKSLGSPILGDRHYSGMAADRVYLHAYSLGFQYQEAPFRVHCLPQEGERFMDPTFHQTLEPYQAPTQLAWPKDKSERNKP